MTPSAAKLAEHPSLPHAGQQTILVVEDESGVRKLVSGVLRAKGNRVTDIGSPDEAITAIAVSVGTIASPA